MILTVHSRAQEDEKATEVQVNVTTTPLIWLILFENSRKLGVLGLYCRLSHLILRSS